MNVHLSVDVDTQIEANSNGKRSRSSKVKVMSNISFFSHHSHRIGSTTTRIVHRTENVPFGRQRERRCAGRPRRAGFPGVEEGRGGGERYTTRDPAAVRIRDGAFARVRRRRVPHRGRGADRRRFRPKYRVDPLPLCSLSVRSNRGAVGRSKRSRPHLAPALVIGSKTQRLI